MPDIIKGKASCRPTKEELNDNPYIFAKQHLLNVSKEWKAVI